LEETPKRDRPTFKRSLNNMKGYIRVSHLFEYFRVPKNTVKSGMKSYNNGKSKAWESRKDFEDKRCKWIKIDTIPNGTIKKYGIYELNYDWDNDVYMIALNNAIESNYIKHLPVYKSILKDDKKAKLHAQYHALWQTIFNLTGEGTTTEKGTLIEVFECYLRLDFPIRLKTYQKFSKRNKKIRLLLAKDENIHNVILHGLVGTKRNVKARAFYEGIGIYYLAHPNQYRYWLVADLINIHSYEYGFKPISVSWVKNLMSNNWVKTLVKETRDGKKKYSDTVEPYLPRTVSPFPGTVWMIDGTPTQFWCIDENGRTIRAYLFVVFDACTRKVVGFSVDKSENRFMIMDAIKMAAKLTGHLPHEIVSDNFSANQTDELQALQANMERLGVTWRKAKVGNAQDKGNVERFFNTFQSRVCSLYPDYLGEGITSRSINGRPDSNFIQKAIKFNGVSDYNQMRFRINEMLGIYNDMEIDKRLSPNEKYKTYDKPYVKELNPEDIAILFWKERTITIKRSIVKFEVNKVHYHYRIKNYDNRLALHGKKVRVRYDSDLSSIMIFDLQTDELIEEIKQLTKANLGLADHTENDEQLIKESHGTKVGFRNYREKMRKEKMKKGMEAVGEPLENFHPLDTITVVKDKHNSEESRQFKELFLVENQDLDKEIHNQKIEDPHTPNWSKDLAENKSIKKTVPATLRMIDED